MDDISFSEQSKNITEKDLECLGKKTGYILPSDFKKHYKKWNGGIPDLDWFPANDDWEPIWINSFLSVGSTENMPSIQSAYEFSINKGILPRNCLPFAIDHGGNFIYVDLEDGKIYFHANDLWDSSLSEEENQEKARRYLTPSFSAFVDSLVSEGEAFE